MKNLEEIYVLYCNYFHIKYRFSSLVFWGERWNIFMNLNVVNLDLGMLLNCVKKNPKEPSQDG